MAEAMNREWNGTIAALERDGLGKEFHTVIAELSEEAIGFACWHRIYNVHYCVSGGEICDMYVTPEFRHHGMVMSLIAAVARQVRASRGNFLRGQSDAHLESLYARHAVVVPGAECYVGGTTFEALASLSAESPRHILRGLRALSKR